MKETPLTVQMDRFRSTFYEECLEHLTEIERILLAVNVDAPVDEDLHALFRSAHTIKGSAGIFGLDDITAVTHHLESLLDRIRNYELTLTVPLVDLFLQAKDVIAMLVAGHRDGDTVDEPQVLQVCTRLTELAEGARPVDASFISSEAAQEPCAVTCSRFEMMFSPDQDLFQRGVRPEYLFEELAQMGELKITALVDTSAAETDPELCHVKWRMDFSGEATEAQIRDVFEFVAEPDQLTVARVESTSRQSGASLPVTESAPQSNDAQMFGRRAYDTNEMAPGAFGRRGGETESSIRVGVAKVDQLINQVGELVITQAMLRQMGANLDPVAFEALHRGLLQLERNTRDLQQSVMSIRLVPISMVFSRFPRLVRELAAKLGKEVELKTVGESTELDKGLIEKIADPLTHLVRNALDHALEMPEERLAAGKPSKGRVTLQASQVGGRVVIQVMDDGRGLSRERILAKAAEKGIAASSGLTDEEVWQLIFTPGFSTAESITDISGRGVGMDVVQKNVQTLGGRVIISSEAGKGTCVTISLPLTLAILNGLSVGVGPERFIVPINAIIESLQPSRENLRTVNGNEVVHVRGEYIPILRLHSIFNLAEAETRPEKGILMVVDVEGEKAAMLVDSLQDELQVVIKSMEDNYRKVEGTSGATILGDGRVALILDVGGLMEAARKRGLAGRVIPDRKEAEVYAG